MANDAKHSVRLPVDPQKGVLQGDVGCETAAAGRTGATRVQLAVEGGSHWHRDRQGVGNQHKAYTVPHAHARAHTRAHTLADTSGTHRHKRHTQTHTCQCTHVHTPSR
jgi:hypothetical protein